jgi:hypothetical protein
MKNDRDTRPQVPEGKRKIIDRLCPDELPVGGRQRDLRTMAGRALGGSAWVALAVRANNGRCVKNIIHTLRQVILDLLNKRPDVKTPGKKPEKYDWSSKPKR